MKTLLFFAMILVFAASLSCNNESNNTLPRTDPIAEATDEPVNSADNNTLTKEKTQIDYEPSKIEALALQKLSDQLEIPISLLNIVSSELIEWPNAAIGCPSPGYAYAQVITTGHKILISYDSRQYQIHTNLSGSNIVLCKDNDPPIPASDVATPSIEFTVLDQHPDFECVSDKMNQFINVFGIYVMATHEASREYVLHTANVLAEYIDNDENGTPDDPEVLKYLAENNFVVPVWTDADTVFRETKCGQNFAWGASMYFDHDQWAIGGIEKAGTWDANLEEVWHIVTKGWGSVYPDAFGVRKPSLLTDALDIARGGYFEHEPPKRYPDSAWYKYYDPTCTYECQAYEYVYWALMANIGALDPELTDKCENSADEWAICTKSDLKAKDILIYQLLNEKNFNLPTRIPDGSYR